VTNQESQRDEAIRGALAAQGALPQDIAGLTDDQARAPSLLPGWSVGHVLTHIARNGDSYVRMTPEAWAGHGLKPDGYR
jgi:maleylpyruvate isomerase